MTAKRVYYYKVPQTIQVPAECEKVTDLAREDSRRDYTRSSAWLLALDALETIISRSRRVPFGPAISANEVLSAIVRGEIPGLTIEYGSDAV